MSKKKSSNKKRLPDSSPTGDADPASAAPSTPSATPSNTEIPITSNPEPDQAPNKSLVSRYVSFGLLLGVVGLAGILFYEVMAQFLIPLFLAAVLVVVFRPLHRRISEKCGRREKLSALLTTGAVLIVVLVPIGAILVMAAAEGRQFYRQFNSTKIVEGVHQIRTNMKLDMPSKRALRLIENELARLQQSIVLTPADEYSHQTVLYEIEESAKQLAKEQGLSWPSKAESEAEPPADASDWSLFATSLMQVRVLQNEIPWNVTDQKSADEQLMNSGDDPLDDDPLDDDPLTESFHNYLLKLNTTSDHFADFRTQFLGGPTRAWMIELVNPSDTKTEAYANSVANLLQEKFFRLTGVGVAYVGNLLLGTAIMIIGLYFFLLDGPKMIETFKGLSPIDDEHEQELVTEFGRVSRAVVLATLLSALAQGFLAGIGFYFAGLDSVFLLTVLSAMLAMVPFVGAASVWVPCCLYLYFFDHQLPAAIGLGIYGVFVISMADNIIKPYVLHGQSNIHPLFALLSVLGGVATLGPIGIVVGPMAVAFLQTLLKILQREMLDFDQLEQAPE